MSDDKVVSLADKADSGAHRSPENALKEALNDIGKNGAFKEGRKLLILCVDEGADGNQYNITWIQAGMKMSQCLTLCEVAKASFLEEMGYISTNTQ